MPAKVLFAVSDCPIDNWRETTPGTDLINTLDQMILESWNKQ